MTDDSDAKRPSRDGHIVVGSVMVVAIAVLCLLAVGVIAILTLLGPALARGFPSSNPIPSCTFETDVFVFEDDNENQIQDAGESGIKDVRVDLTIIPSDLPRDTVAVTTDTQGFAHLFNGRGYCSSVDSFEIVVNVPSGYQATTETTFGPLLREYMNYQPGERYVGLISAP
jgi:hypothetical protein